MTTKAKSKAKKADKPKSMLVGDIDPKLWQAFQVRAAQEGRTIKWLFHDFIARYAGGGK
jgi:hypothetical protein